VLRRHTSPAGRVVIPILFVVLLIGILGRLLLDIALDIGDPPTLSMPTRPESEQEDESSGPTKLAVRYPKECLRAASAPGSGLIAAVQGGSIGVGTPEGSSAFALRAAPPVGFSAGGTFLATAGADLWSDEGEHLGLAFNRPVKRWAWSPTGDCLVGIDRGRVLVVRPDGRPEVLVRGVPVSNFSFSPDGTRLLFVITGRSRAAGIWMADLRTRAVKQLQEETGWTLTAWSRASRPILLRDESGEAGSSLSFAPADEVAYCGSEVLTVQRDRLATFGVSGVPTYLDTDRRFRYAGVTCSPDEDLLVTIRYPKGDPTSTALAVLRDDGSFVREFGQSSSVEDGPMWGPSGTGIVFVGEDRGGAGPLVWFLPEGGKERPTGLRVERLGDDLEARLDWSATTPLGHPTN
jgi:hypothetical protein